MKKFLLLVLVFPLIALGDDRNAVMGMWASDGSIFEILEEQGEFLGVIRVLRDSTYTMEENPERVGEIKTDDENPDLALRARPVVGISMFSEYEYKDQLWQGKIYDPETGNTYNSRMEVDKNGRLKIRGYIGLPLFGRTAIFSPVSSCEPHIKQMLAMISGDQCQVAIPAGD